MDPKRAINGTFCPIPWTGFIMNPDGEIKNCVISEQKLGNINDTDIQDILGGQANTQVKTCMNADKQHTGCINCYKNEQGTAGLKNVRSDRYYYLKALSGIPYSAYDTMDTTLGTVDMRWRNTCNLACVYCGPTLSSTWAKELGVDIGVNMLWFILNPYTVFDTVDYFKALGYSENSFVIGALTSPKAFDVRNCNSRTLLDLQNHLKMRIQGANRNYFLHNSYVNMLKHLDETFDKHSSKQRLKEMDTRRGQNYKNVFDIDKYL